MPTILVVDDDADTCQNMADLFGDWGYAIETAESGDTALVKARQRAYDLGLLDVRMPGMDGLTLCEHLKRLQPPMVTMLVTAYGGDDLDRKARAAGARHVLLKPVDFPRLVTLVEDVLVARERVMPGLSRGHMTLTNALGFHLRAVNRFVQLCQQFQAKVRVFCNSRTADGCNVLDLLMLTADCGARLEIEATGPDAEKAIAVLCTLIQQGFHEDEQERSAWPGP